MCNDDVAAAGTECNDDVATHCNDDVAEPDADYNNYEAALTTRSRSMAALSTPFHAVWSWADFGAPYYGPSLQCIDEMGDVTAAQLQYLKQHVLE